MASVATIQSSIQPSTQFRLGARSRRGLPACGGLALALICAGPFVASVSASAQELAAQQLAQDQGGDYRPLLDRLDRLERDLNLLQRQVYRGKIEDGDGAATPGAPGTAGSGAASASANPGSAADMEVRVSGLESQLRSVNGSIEEVKHSVDELKTRLDKLVADVDMRLAAMEQNAAKAKQGEQTAAAATPPGADANSLTPIAPQPAPDKGAGDKGQVALVPPAETGAAETGAAGSGEAAAPAEGALPQGTPLEQYEYARGLLAKADYPGAEKTLKVFIKTYPSNDLTENAEYWLAETYYVRSNYVDAAKTYADGYKKFPAGAKAPDNLLKLGLSLANLDQAEQACKAFAEIDRKFPAARTDIRDRAAAERKQRACK